MKAYVYETFEQLGRIPANIVIPVGNGTLFIGAVKALEHLHASGAIERFPNIIALKSEKCDPLYRAREAGLEDPARVTPAPTMAAGIAIGVPMRGREILDMMKRHDIRVVHAPEDRILEARACSPAAASTASTPRPPTTPPGAATASSTAPRPTRSSPCAAQASSPTTDPHAQPLRLPAPQGTATRIRPLHHPPCGLLPPSHPAS